MALRDVRKYLDSGEWMARELFVRDTHRGLPCRKLLIAAFADQWSKEEVASEVQRSESAQA
jgi:hypothetical protein